MEFTALVLLVVAPCFSALASPRDSEYSTGGDGDGGDGGDGRPKA